MTRKKRAARAPTKRSRVIALLLVLGGLVFGFWGGEYSTVDWWTLKRQVAREAAGIARLEQEIDSLAPMAQALEQDPAMQEWVAREKFGMVRPGEVMYQVEVER